MRKKARKKRGFLLVPALLVLVVAVAMVLGAVAPASAGGDGGESGHGLGLAPSDTTGFEQVGAAPGGVVGLPTSVNLSGHLPPVGNQRDQGSCVGWATSYYYKTWAEKQEHPTSNLSDPNYQFSPSFVYNQINGGVDRGASFSDAFSLLQNKGDLSMAQFPYDAGNYTRQPTAAQLQAALPFRIRDWSYFWVRWGESTPYGPANDISSIKSWLASGKVLAMAIPVYYDFPDDSGNPESAYYDYDDYSSCRGYHAVCVCGYNDNANPYGSNADHRGGFLMVNSWGANWNDNGYVYLSYDFVKRYTREAWLMNDQSNGPTPLHISSLSPTYGNAGSTVVTISGTSFGNTRGSSSVWFGGSKATDYVSWKNTQIKVRVGAGASGQAHVKVLKGGAYSNAKAFDVRPVINGIDVTSGPAGMTLTISGSAFCNTRGTGAVYFGSTPADAYYSWKQSQIKVYVPGAAPRGIQQVKVYTKGGLSNVVSFTKN